MRQRSDFLDGVMGDPVMWVDAGSEARGPTFQQQDWDSAVATYQPAVRENRSPEEVVFRGVTWGPLCRPCDPLRSVT